MIFIVSGDGRPPPGQVRVVLVRHAPDQGSDAEHPLQVFCVDDDEAAPERLRQAGYRVIDVHDGWYPDDGQGGVAIWGQGRYWEVRPTPFEVALTDADA